jgi:hypothetical protein
MIAILLIIILIFLWYNQKQKEYSVVYPNNNSPTLPQLTADLKGPATIILQSQARLVVQHNGETVLVKSNSDPKPVRVEIKTLESSDVIRVVVTRVGSASKAVRGQIEWLGGTWPLNPRNAKVTGDAFGQMTLVDKRAYYTFSPYNVDWETDWVWDEVPEDSFEFTFTAPESISAVHDYDFIKNI